MTHNAQHPLAPGMARVRRLNHAYRTTLVHSHERAAQRDHERTVLVRCTHNGCSPSARKGGRA